MLTLTNEQSYALVLEVANGRMDKAALATRLEECVISTLE